MLLLGLRTTMYWFGIFSVAVAIDVCIPTRLDCVDGLLSLWLSDSDSCSCSCCCLFIPISDPVVVPNGSEFDGGDNDGVGSKNGGCSADKAIAFGMSNNDDPELNMGEDVAIAMITKVNAE